jgi:hypothetical protein
MKLSQLMVAIGALAAAGVAVAGTPGNRIAVSAGASATQGNLNQTIINLCTAAGGQISRFPNPLSGNFTTLVCSDTANLSGAAYDAKTTGFINFAGLPYAEFRLNVALGSLGSLALINNQPLLFRNPVTNTDVATLPSGAVRVGGLSDLDPARGYPGTTLAQFPIQPTPVAAGFAQSFGVGVSRQLYNAMYRSQRSAGNATVNQPIPSTCPPAPAADTDATVGTDRPECVPTISKGQMASIMTDNGFNSAYLNGANFLASSLPAGTQLRYARRVDTSGTQGSAQVYFLGLPCVGIDALPIVPEPTGDDEPGGLRDTLINSIRVLAAGGTSDVRNELNSTTNYAIGILSGENNQSGVNWRWLRVQGAPMSENAVPGTLVAPAVPNRQSVINGSYDFYFESVSLAANSAGTSFWATVLPQVDLSNLPGIVPSANLQAGFNKAGASCRYNSSN